MKIVTRSKNRKYKVDTIYFLLLLNKLRYHFLNLEHENPYNRIMRNRYPKWKTKSLVHNELPKSMLNKFGTFIGTLNSNIPTSDMGILFNYPTKLHTTNVT